MALTLPYNVWTCRGADWNMPCVDWQNSQLPPTETTTKVTFNPISSLQQSFIAPSQLRMPTAEFFLSTLVAGAQKRLCPLVYLVCPSFFSLAPLQTLLKLAQFAVSHILMLTFLHVFYVRTFPPDLTMTWFVPPLPTPTPTPPSLPSLPLLSPPLPPSPWADCSKSPYPSAPLASRELP